jgi:hypothetical protein
MRGEDLVDDVAVAQGPDGQTGYWRFVPNADQLAQQLVVSPGFASEQALQCLLHIVISCEFVGARVAPGIARISSSGNNMSNHSLLILAFAA